MSIEHSLLNIIKARPKGVSGRKGALEADSSVTASERQEGLGGDPSTPMQRPPTFTPEELTELRIADRHVASPDYPQDASVKSEITAAGRKRRQSKKDIENALLKLMKADEDEDDGYNPPDWRPMPPIPQRNIDDLRREDPTLFPPDMPRSKVHGTEEIDSLMDPGNPYSIAGDEEGNYNPEGIPEEWERQHDWLGTTGTRGGSAQPIESLGNHPLRHDTFADSMYDDEVHPDIEDVGLFPVDADLLHHPRKVGDSGEVEGMNNPARRAILNSLVNLMKAPPMHVQQRQGAAKFNPMRGSTQKWGTRAGIGAPRGGGGSSTPSTPSASEIESNTPGAADTRVGFNVGNITDKIGRMAEGALTKPVSGLASKLGKPVTAPEGPALGTAENPLHYIQDNKPSEPNSTGGEMPEAKIQGLLGTGDGDTPPPSPQPKGLLNEQDKLTDPKPILNSLLKLMKADSAEDIHRLIEEAGAKNAAKKKALREQRAQYLATDLGDADLDSETQRLMSKPITPPEPPIYSGRVLGLDEFFETDPHGDESFSSSSTEYKPSRKPTKRDMQEFSIENSLLKLMKNGGEEEDVDPQLRFPSPKDPGDLQPSIDEVMEWPEVNKPSDPSMHPGGETAESSMYKFGPPDFSTELPESEWFKEQEVAPWLEDNPEEYHLQNSLLKLMKGRHDSLMARDPMDEEDRSRRTTYYRSNEDMKAKRGGVKGVPPKNPEHDLFWRGDNPEVEWSGQVPESLRADKRNIGPMGGTQGSALDWDRDPQSDQNPINMPELTRESKPPFGTRQNPRQSSMYMRNSIEKSLLKLMQ